MIPKLNGVSKRARAAAQLLAALCILTPATGSPVPAAAPSARAEEKRITVEFYPAGGAAEKTNPVVLSFNGKLYDNVPLPTTGAAPALAEDEKFLARVIATNRQGSLEDVLKLWNPPEREAVRKFASDAKTFEANRKFFSSIGNSFLRAKIYYGNYVIFIVRHSDQLSGERFKDYPLKKVRDEYFLTNELSGDPVFQYLTTKYVNKLREP